ncbi:TetR/AcrR family transcriptional regulator [Undibacterium sp.]|uniref:TetR/AcrR family transcriptional regulator n=1 Tax=Undibacterium sp. TaxID=1914977 RepID=UPI00374DAE5B
MGRPKKFSREGVLEKVIPVFWQLGYSGTRLQDLEMASGVNKSGLYSEFKDKEDLFLASLQHYLKNRGGRALLIEEPLGWSNVERFLRMADGGFDGKLGCFSVNSMREFVNLPAEAQKMVAEGRSMIKGLLANNIRSEGSKAAAETIAEMVLVFFSGMCIEQNLDDAQESSSRKIDNFIEVARGL